MSGQICLIDGCQARVYAPAGTRSVCKDHFLGFLTWRRRRGPQMFRKYAGMTMEERDVIAAEWLQTLGTKDLPTPFPDCNSLILTRASSSSSAVHETHSASH